MKLLRSVLGIALVLALAPSAAFAVNAKNKCKDGQCEPGTFSAANWCQEGTLEIDGKAYKSVREIFECQETKDCGAITTIWVSVNKFEPCD